MRHFFSNFLAFSEYLNFTNQFPIFLGVQNSVQSNISPVIMSPDNSFTSPSSKNSNMSSLRNIRKDMRKQNVSMTKVEPTTTPVKLELSGPVRKPTLREKNDFFKQISFDQKCPKCEEIVWYEDTHKDLNMRQKVLARHAFKKHLNEEMKVCLHICRFCINLYSNFLTVILFYFSAGPFEFSN